MLEDFQDVLDGCIGPEDLDPSWSDSKRRLGVSQYLSLFLFGLVNPVFKTMRALVAASDLERMQEDVCAHSVSLGSFSEAQSLVEVEILQKVFGRLVQENRKIRKPRPGAFTKEEKAVLAIDSSLWAMLPRMSWAVWRHQGKTQRAMRLHLAFNVWDQTPADFEMTPGKTCERKAWKKMIQSGDFYVGDRNYGENYKLLAQVDRKGCGYIVRLRQNAQWVVQESLEISQADELAGVIEHSWARLGTGGKGPRVRIVRILGQEEQLALATNQEPKDMSAEVVGELYRRRWQVEIYFRWIKCTLGARHWFAESQQGAAIQIYLALIAALLLTLNTGRRVNKRQMEAIQAFMQGWAKPEELERMLKKHAGRGGPRQKS